MKATIYSGMMYKAVVKDETEKEVRFVADNNGRVWTWDNDNKAIEIPVTSIANMSDIKMTDYDFTMITDENGVLRMWDDVIFRHNDEYYTRDEAIREIKLDDDLFREYIDDNAGYVDICNHTYYTDYDTLENWGILENIRDDWDDDIENMLGDDDISDWDLVDSNINSIMYYVLDNGVLVNSDMIDTAIISDLIGLIMGRGIDNRIGDWIITRAPTEINDVNTNTIVPTINPDSERPITLTGRFA